MIYFKDVAIKWLQNGATKDEMAEIYLACSSLLNFDEKKLISDCVDYYMETPQPLRIIKLIKDRTGWNLKESKSFYDGKIIPRLSELNLL